MMNVNPQWNILSIILNPRSCPNSPTTGLWPPVMAWGHPIFTPTDFQKWDLQTSQRWDKPWTRAQNTHRNNPLGVLVRPKEGSGGDFWDTGPKVGKIGKKRENLVLAIFWRFFSEIVSYLKNHFQTPPRAEPRPPMEWFPEYFEPLITIWLADLWSAALLYGQEGPLKISQSTLTKFQKGDLQTRDRRVKRWSRAQNTHKTNRLGVSVQPEEGSGTDFWDMGFTLSKFGILTLWNFMTEFFLARPISQKSEPDLSSGWTKTPNESLLWTFWAPDDPLTRRPLVCGSLFWVLRGVILENFTSVDIPKMRCVGRTSWSWKIINSWFSR